MFAKLATVIIVLGAMYGALLVNRQKRIDAASQISRMHFRILEADRERAKLQAKVARATTATELKRRIGEEKLAEYRSVPFRHDPSKATEDAMGDPLTVAQPENLRKSQQEIGG
jgi:hypothetical protein